MKYLLELQDGIAVCQTSAGDDFPGGDPWMIFDTYEEAASHLGQRWTGSAWEAVPLPEPEPEAEPVTAEVLKARIDALESVMIGCFTDLDAAISGGGEG